ncbi:MAG: flagellar hook-associated protein FlgL [Lentisphaerota bacterium]
MRVTNQTVNEMLSRYIINNRNSVFDIQQKIASGKKILNPSDDPNGYDTIVRLEDSLACIQQYDRNAVQLKNELLNTDGTLQQVTDVLHRVSELIVTASNGTTPPEDRQTISKEVDQLLEDMVNLANSNPEGRYIFGGLRTNAQPYVVTRDANGQIVDVTYQGNQDVRQVEVGKNAFVPANIPGTDAAGGMAVFQSQNQDVFSDLIQLRDRLAAGENPVDPEFFTADPAADLLTTTKLYRTGSLVRVDTTGALPGGLEAGRDYYAIQVSPTQIRLADSYANAQAGIFIDITSAGVGTHNITQQSLQENTRDLEHITSILGVVGAREQRLETCQSILSQYEEDVSSSLEDVQAIDLAKAMTELSDKKLAYEAALRATSGLLDVSLLNYI